MQLFICLKRITIQDRCLVNLQSAQLKCFATRSSELKCYDSLTLKIWVNQDVSVLAISLVQM